MEISDIWTEKYRPSTLDKIISHKNIIHTLKQYVAQKTLPHLLFYGGSGTGKTTAIIACAKELYGDNFQTMVLELNASDERGIETVRKRIKQFVITRNVIYSENQPSFKLIILDETDAMTDDAQANLRRLIENSTENARFCLICNYLKKISLALQSRCTIFKFSPLDNNDILQRINEISTIEHINITDSAIKTILENTNGDMRKVLNILQSLSISYNIIDQNNVNACLGILTTEQLNTVLLYLLEKDFSEAYNLINTLRLTLGFSLIDLLNGLYKIIIKHIIKEEVSKILSKLDNEHICNILIKLSQFEYDIIVCVTENIQLASFIGCFKAYNY